MATRRQQKVASVIQHAVSDAVANHLNDPRIEGFVSVTRVDVSPDMRNADVYLSIFGKSPASQNRTFVGISHAKGKIQSLLAGKLQSYHPPLTFFGGLKTENGRLDLKIGGLFPVVASARALAIRHNILHRSTLDRLTHLKDLEIGGDADLERMITAQAVLLRAILSQQLRDLEAGKPIGNSVEVKTLSRPEQDRLKDTLGGLSIVADLVRDLLFR